MSKRRNISSGVKWEDIVGYSRAVIVEGRILISGTTSIIGGEIRGKGDFYIQTKTILQKIEKILIDAGSSMEKVIRTRIYTTDISKWEEIGRAHCEFFDKVRPATAMIEIKGLVDPEMLVEIEAEAIE
ncbi:MAG: 2-iminobutanoate/2-iminopropanoate deaminase [Ignavibacteria bacterium]|nr:2-iminobutanoate/2-iminopropanoate deaminase [Ignavibacteria bacterium]